MYVFIKLLHVRAFADIKDQIIEFPVGISSF